MGCGHMLTLNLSIFGVVFVCLLACFNSKVCLCLLQSAGIKGMHHHSWLSSFLRKHERKRPSLKSPNPILRQRAVWLAAYV